MLTQTPLLTVAAERQKTTFTFTVFGLKCVISTRNHYHHTNKIDIIAWLFPFSSSHFHVVHPSRIYSLVLFSFFLYFFLSFRRIKISEQYLLKKFSMCSMETMRMFVNKSVLIWAKNQANILHVTLLTARLTPTFLLNNLTQHCEFTRWATFVWLVFSSVFCCCCHFSVLNSMSSWMENYK